MPHKHKPRINKQLKLLLESNNDDLVVKSLFDADRENRVSKLSLEESTEIKNIIYNRYSSADETTKYEARKMEEMDRLYYGVFEEGEQREGQTYLNKTRENVKLVYSYLMQLVSEITPIITCYPATYNTLTPPEAQFRKAKVTEALINYQFDSIWHIRDDKFPSWLKCFLKYSLAIWKITYTEDNARPDLRLDVVDRALLRIDPFVDDIKDAKWVCEDQFISRSEVREMRDYGYWDLTDDEIDRLSHANDTIHDSIATYDTKRRIFGKLTDEQYTTVDQDDLIQIVHYWQADKKGLDDAYAVIVGGVEGGILARYGRNPFPYKGVPYRAKSYDPHESQLDGTGLVEEFAPLQRHINNIFELRNKDLQNNVIDRKVVPPELFDDRSMEAWQDQDKFVPMSQEFYQRMMNDPEFDVRRHILDLGVRTSTDNLIQNDLLFVLQQAKENTFVNDTFKGQASSAQMTLGQSRDILMQTQGAFRPVYLQIMRGFAELGEICNEYFRSLEFYSVDRIIHVIGPNKYQDVLQNWHKIPNSDVQVRQIMPDELEIDVTIDAVTGADAVASRVAKNTQMAEFLQALGQIPDAYPQISKELNMTKMIYQFLDINGMDAEALRYTDEEIAQKQEQAKQQEQQQQQLLMEQQQQIEELKRQTMQFNAKLQEQTQVSIQQARAGAQTQIDANRGQIDLQKMQQEFGLKLQEMVQQAQVELEKKLQETTHRLNEETKSKDYLMREEAKLESKDPSIVVGHGNNINQ